MAKVNLLKKIFDCYIENNGASSLRFRSKEDGRTYRVAFEDYEKYGVTSNSVIKLVDVNCDTVKKTYTAFGSIDVLGDCMLEPIDSITEECISNRKDIADGTVLATNDLVFVYKKTDDIIRGYHSYVTVLKKYVDYDETANRWVRVANNLIFDKDNVCLKDVCYPFMRDLHIASDIEIAEFKSRLGEYGYYYDFDENRVMFNEPLVYGDYISISEIDNAIGANNCIFILSQNLESPAVNTICVRNDNYLDVNGDANTNLMDIGDSLIRKVSKDIGDAFFSVLNDKDVYWNADTKAFEVRPTSEEKLREIEHFKPYVEKLEEVWEREQKASVERAQATRETMKKKIVEDTNGTVTFEEPQKIFETEDNTETAATNNETEVYGRVTTKIINLIKNTPLTNEELKKINDVVFDQILSNTSKGSVNDKRGERTNS